MLISAAKLNIITLESIRICSFLCQYPVGSRGTATNLTSWLSFNPEDAPRRSDHCIAALHVSSSSTEEPDLNRLSQTHTAFKKVYKELARRLTLGCIPNCIIVPLHILFWGNKCVHTDYSWTCGTLETSYQCLSCFHSKRGCQSGATYEHMARPPTSY